MGGGGQVPEVGSTPGRPPSCAPASQGGRGQRFPGEGGGGEEGMWVWHWLTRPHVQMHVDAVTLQRVFIGVRDEICDDGKRLWSPALEELTLR